MTINDTNLYQLSYDNDWGCRGNRRTVVWYFTERMNKKKTLEFLSKQSLCLSVDERAFEWRKLKLNYPYSVLIGK